MKRRLYVLILGLILLIPFNVNAASTCSYSTKTELKQEAWNVQFDYEYLEESTVVPDEPFPDVRYYYEIKAYNLSPNLVLRISNNQNDDVSEFDYVSSKDGEVIYRVAYNDKVTTYTLELFAASGECEGELLISDYLTTPRKNMYATYSICSEIPDFYLCQQFITYENDVEIDQFFAKAEAYKKEDKIEKEEQEEEKREKKKTNTVLIITGSILVIGGIATFVVIKKKRSRKIYEKEY